MKKKQNGGRKSLNIEHSYENSNLMCPISKCSLKARETLIFMEKISFTLKACIECLKKKH